MLSTPPKHETIKQEDQKIEIRRTRNKKNIVKTGIAVFIPLIIAGFLIYHMIGFTVPDLIQNNERVEAANQGLNDAAWKVLDVCSELNRDLQRVWVEHGPGPEYTQTKEMYQDGIQSCTDSLTQIQDSCRVIPLMQVCKDPRLEQLSSNFARIKP